MEGEEEEENAFVMRAAMEKKDGKRRRERKDFPASKNGFPPFLFYFC